MASPDQVKAEVSRDVRDADFVQRLAERIGGSTRASAVFGEPVEQSGVTIIPVAKTTWGFGGGSGGDGATQGSGGGGAGIVAPIGFIEIRAGNARFVRIRDLPSTALRLAVAAGFVVWTIRR
jgi:uncharacterized spore protein YtfJ